MQADKSRTIDKRDTNDYKALSEKENHQVI